MNQALYVEKQQQVYLSNGIQLQIVEKYMHIVDKARAAVQLCRTLLSTKAHLHDADDAKEGSSAAAASVGISVLKQYSASENQTKDKKGQKGKGLTVSKSDMLEDKTPK